MANSHLQIALPGVTQRGTLAEALDWLIRNSVETLRPWTVHQHNDHRRWLLEYFGADRRLDEITYEVLCKFRDDNGPRGRGLMLTTVKKRLMTLRMALREAFNRGIISAMPPWPKLRSDSRPGERYITLAQFRQLRLQLEPRWRLWIDIAFWTGMHRADVSSMRWKHVDLSGKSWLRRNTKNHALAIPLPLPKELHNALVDEFELAAPIASDRIVGPWHRAVRSLAAACEAAGVPRVSPQDFRRSLATHMASIGVDKDVIRRYLGHSGKSEMLDRVYVKIPVTRIEDAVAALDNAG